MGFEPEKSRRQGGVVSGLRFCCEEGRNRGIVDGGILQCTGLHSTKHSMGTWGLGAREGSHESGAGTGSRTDTQGPFLFISHLLPPIELVV